MNNFNFARFVKHALCYALISFLTLLCAGVLIGIKAHGIVIALALAVGWGITPAAITESLLKHK